jgi:Kef-type K+ transport system membrane component KefB
MRWGQMLRTVQDLTVVLTASSVFGCFFEAIKQPVLNGYILAGSLAGPDGFALIKEMVQVESLAQVLCYACCFGPPALHERSLQARALW